MSQCSVSLVESGHKDEGNINVTMKAAVTGLWVSLPTAARLSLSHRLMVGTRCSLGVWPSWGRAVASFSGIVTQVRGHIHWHQTRVSFPRGLVNPCPSLVEVYQKSCFSGAAAFALWMKEVTWLALVGSDWAKLKRRSCLRCVRVCVDDPYPAARLISHRAFSALLFRAHH